MEEFWLLTSPSLQLALTQVASSVNLDKHIIERVGQPQNFNHHTNF